MAELVSNSTIFLNTDSVEEREKSLCGIPTENLILSSITLQLDGVL